MVKRLFYITFLTACLFKLSNLQAQQIVKVEKLANGVNSESEEILPLLNTATNQLYFSRLFYAGNKGGKYSGADIWLFNFNDTTSAATQKTVENLNTKGHNFVIGIKKSEPIIYTNNSMASEKGFQFSTIKNGTWQKPETIKIPGLPNNGYRGLSISDDYKVAILSMVGAYGQEDLFYALLNSKGNWQKPISLGASINTSGREISPFLSSDKRTLYFASDGHGGEGDLDIFSTERLYDNWEVWSTPKNLGPKVNSPQFDAYYSQYGDSIAFLSSNRDGGLADIFRIQYQKKSAKRNAGVKLRAYQ